ncbi:conserved hypothetical protein [Borreliella spielmanii A14S]|uniref:Uncharacterized protein n=1 Tax=Borreliella spielmanii A14S TaxID=498742 RepID=C0APN7_9SPIR|nr:conserved hypothetical protein [Borreliella spielmanii A14S]
MKDQNPGYRILIIMHNLFNFSKPEQMNLRNKLFTPYKKVKFIGEI